MRFSICLQVSRPVNAQIFPQLLHFTNMPQPIAGVVINTGARFTYHQLLSAVKAGVPGVAVWVKAYTQITGSRPVGMHPAAEAMCCDGDVSKTLEVRSLACLLLIVVVTT